MKKTIFTFLLLLIAIQTWGIPNDSEKIIRLQREVSNLKDQDTRLLQADSKMQMLYQVQSSELDSLKSIQMQLANNVEMLAQKVGADLSEANKKIDDNANTLSDSINARTWIGLICLMVAIGLLGLIYYLLRKKIISGSSTIDKIRCAQEGLETAQKLLQEESLKLDSKLVELLDKKIETTSTPNAGEQIDHTLALKVADEIVRIETNLSRMDTSVKGYKQLSRAVERIRSNFLANGYEIVEMLNKPYNEGMKVVANFISDDTLAEGEQKITGIIKPQINFKGKMIQSAQITVSQNI